MGTAILHPSPRRFSCDICRKHKSRCQRINRTDPKCARCTMLDVPCTRGQQKTVGRPRRKPAFASLSPTAEPPPTASPNQPISSSPDTFQQNNLFMEGWEHFDWSGMLSPSPSPTQLPMPAVDNTFCAAPAWPSTTIDTFDQPFSSWDPSFDMDGTNSPFNTVSDFAMTDPNAYTREAFQKTALQLQLTKTSFTSNNTMKTGYLDRYEAPDTMFELSKINLDLHVRLVAIKKNITTLDFDSMVYQRGPQYIDNITLGEFTIKVSQEFLQIVTQLLSNQQCAPLLDASPATEMTTPKQRMSPKHRKGANKHHSAAAEPLSAPIALMITSIFIQLVSIYELTIDRLTTCVERIATDPISPVPCLTFGRRPLERPCTQGMLFCELSVSLMESIERGLGIIPISEGREPGLLSPNQIEMLGHQLDERVALIPGPTMLTPTDLRKLFGRVADIFRNIPYSP